MPDLSFRFGEVTPLSYAAVPTLRAPLHIENRIVGQRVQSISLNCQVQIETLGRPYTSAEEVKLLDLFGERERWARTMKPMLWINSVLKVPSFDTETVVDLLLPCSLDFDVAATKYFYGLDVGEIAVNTLFSGTVFYADSEGSTQIAQIPWDREARFRLAVEAWKAAIDAHYESTVWMRLPRQVFQRLYVYRVARGIPTLEQAIVQLMDHAESREVRETLAAGGTQR